MEKLSEKRKRLLLELENLIGNECYNANIQNWGPHGVFEGEGREFRYPITFIDSEGKKDKRRSTDATIPAEKKSPVTTRSVQISSRLFAHWIRLLGISNANTISKSEPPTANCSRAVSRR